MPTTTSLQEIARPLDDRESLGRVLDELLAARPEPPAVLALGEPTHGIEAFPLLRNDFLSHLVDRGFRSIALETDIFAASIVDDYVCGAPAELETVLATGFSHGFGAVPGNRELVDWLRAHNSGVAPEDRVRFHGFDAPLEFSAAPSPRRALSAVVEYLPAPLRPASIRDLDALLGDDADWTDEAAMFDPAVSIGNSDRARELRLVADDLAGALHRAGPRLRPADPDGYEDAVTHARTASGLLRYHAAMATAGPDRIGSLLGIRAEMMAANLLALVAQEQRRGPILLFAHNAHLQRAESGMQVGPENASWCSAGALAGLELGERYVFVATDAAPHPEPGTLQHALAAATGRKALFPVPELRAALPSSVGAGEPIVPGHIPLTPAAVAGADAVVFVADTDGTRKQYW
ncbi:erythromycin esterase family protein [Rhodococcus sp. NPDC003382]